MDDVEPWRAELSNIIGLEVDLQVAHPELTDKLWRYLEVDGCALIFERK